MANLGNAWHIPDNLEPGALARMRDPIGAIVPGTTLTIYSGSQFQDSEGNSTGNQLLVGSNVHFKRSTGWTSVPMNFVSQVGNNKYYSAVVTADGLNVGDVFRYYLEIAFSDHDPTFLAANAANASITVPTAADAQDDPFTITMANPAVFGLWSGIINLQNVPIHAHLLPNKTVLYWGRRTVAGDHTPPAGMTPDEIANATSLNVHETKAFIYDPSRRTDSPVIQQPVDEDGGNVNLFCSGHTFLPDGRLMVVGGHYFDGMGINQATIYNYKMQSWTRANQKKEDASKSHGRWYPSVVTLADGSVAVCSGSFVDLTDAQEKLLFKPKGVPDPHINDILERWDGTQWTISADFLADTKLDLPLFPRLHVAPNLPGDLAPEGQLFMAGGMAKSFFLKLVSGHWTQPNGLVRKNMAVDYAPSVMYDTGKIVFIGGGLNSDPNAGTNTSSGPPIKDIEMINLNVASPKWTPGNPMNFARRQHNATILPDGTVLVTGGTSGAGGPGVSGFNDLTLGRTVHTAEIWNPAGGNGGTWTIVGAESVDRCYHSTAVLLPDGTVISGGGGEYSPNNDDIPNPPSATHSNLQIFSPPYLFKKETQPAITAAPTAAVNYGQIFTVVVDSSAPIQKVTWIRLASVTHSFDQNQRLNVLEFVADGPTLTVTAPATADLCPPGHYMLFVVDADGVPSVAEILQIPPPAAPVAAAAVVKNLPMAPVAETLAVPVDDAPLVHVVDKFKRAKELSATAKFRSVRAGVTPTCPYGLSACWAGANEALQSMSNVANVRPFPKAQESIARVYMKNGRLPDLKAWAKEFRTVANGIHHLIGVEVHLEGPIDWVGEQPVLRGTGTRPTVALRQIRSGEKIHWNLTAHAPWPVLPREARALSRVKALLNTSLDPQRVVKIAGPLFQTEKGYEMAVRRLEPTVKSVAHAPLTQMGRHPLTAADEVQSDGLAPGFKPAPRNDLSFKGGRTIQNLSYLNFFIGAWNAGDRENVDSNLEAVMKDPGLNAIIAQYFGDNPIGTTMLPSQTLPDLGLSVVNKTDVEQLIQRLHAEGALGEVDFRNTVFNFLLPSGVFLTDDVTSGADHHDHAAAEEAQNPALVHPHEEDEDDSRAGLGGYHGSVIISDADVAQTVVYYAVGVFSEVIGGVNNGIPVFDQPWKNVVATFYHELTEARTDPDVELGNNTGNARRFGWVASNGEIGDIPIDLASNINMVIKEIQLADGEFTPVQLMYSNRVHGPEEPVHDPIQLPSAR